MWLLRTLSIRYVGNALVRREFIYPLLRSFTAFTVAQTERLDPQSTQPKAPTWDPGAKGEELLLMSGARFRLGGARAF